MEEKVKKHVLTCVTRLKNLGFETLVLAINNDDKGFASSVNMERDNLMFSVFKFAHDMGDTDTIDEMVRSLFAAREKIIVERDIEPQVKKIFDDLDLKVK